MSGTLTPTGSEKISDIGHRWVQSTGQKKFWYRWVPSTAQKKNFGYRWVLGNDQIFNDADPCFKIYQKRFRASSF